MTCPAFGVGQHTCVCVGGGVHVRSQEWVHWCAQTRPSVRVPCVLYHGRSWTACVPIPVPLRDLG